MGEDIQFIKDNPSVYKVCCGDRCVSLLNLERGTITNKFNVVTEFLESLSKFDPAFGNMLCEILTFFQETEDEEKRFEFFMSKIPDIKSYVSRYLDFLNVDFSSFINRSKVKKTTIFFDEEELRKIILISSYLKVYALIYNSDLAFSNWRHRIVYNEFVKDLVEDQIISKIYEVVKTKVFRYGLTDRAMWNYIKRVKNKTMDIHVIEIFNFIMQSILVLCSPDRNPVTFFSTVVDESVKWLLRGVYRDSILYDDGICSTRIHENSQGSNLKALCSSSTLNRLWIVASRNLHHLFESNLLEDPEKSLPDITKDISMISPLTECVTYPLLSKALKIPYQSFLDLFPDQAAVLSAYLGMLLPKYASKDFKTISQALFYYPGSKNGNVGGVVSTTYRIKFLKEFLDSQEGSTFFGFKTKTLPCKIISHYVGKFLRTDFYHIVTKERLLLKPSRKIEEETIKFLSLLFSSSMDDVISKLQLAISKSL